MAETVSLVDRLSKYLSVASVAIATAAALYAWPLDRDIKRLQVEAARLDQELKRTDAQLKEEASQRAFTFELYKEVKSVLQKADRTPREEDAARVLVESLAEDPLRWKLLEVLAVGASSAAVRDSAKKTSTFYQEQAAVSTSASAPTEPSSSTSAFADFAVDIFWCETKRATSEPLARALLGKKPRGATGVWRLRLLPESVNRRAGYGITTTTIRFTPPDERAAATALRELLGTSAVMQEIAYPTPRYVSVFICQ